MSPPGAIHYTYWKKFLPIAIFIGMFMVIVGIEIWPSIGYVTFGVTIILGYLLHLVCDPDLDQVSITLVEGRILRNFGCFGAVYVGYWLPYGAIFKHRSFWSHAPGVSTAIRMIYGFWWVGYIVWVNDWYSNNLLVPLFGIFVGLFIADFIHWFLDKVM